MRAKTVTQLQHQHLAAVHGAQNLLLCMQQQHEGVSNILRKLFVALLPLQAPSTSVAGCTLQVTQCAVLWVAAGTGQAHEVRSTVLGLQHAMSLGKTGAAAELQMAVDQMLSKCPYPPH